MQYANIGNIKASKIILGTWQAGKEMWAGIDDQETITAIQTAVELGISTIDTAAVYGSGHSERIVSAALKKLPRNSYQIATKVFADKLEYHQVIKECENSLKNLQTDYIDLYQIHWPAGSFGSKIIPISDTMKALNQLKKEGKIKAIGVSNFSKEQIIEAMEYGEIVSNQPPYSLIWRPYDKETNPYCRANGIAVLSYSPLAQGILTGKFNLGHQFAKGDHRSHNKFMHPEIFPHVARVLDDLKEIATNKKTTIANIALHWLINQPHTFAIVGVRNAKQVQDLTKIFDFTLSQNEMKQIDTLSREVTANMDQSGMMWDW